MLLPERWHQQQQSNLYPDSNPNRNRDGQRGPSDPRPKQPKLRQSAQSLLWSSPCTTEVLTFTLTLTLTLALTLTLTLRTV